MLMKIFNCALRITNYALLFCATIIFFAGCGNDNPPAEESKVEKISSISREGEIALSNELKIFSPVSGSVIETYFEDGQEVKEGQQLFKIGDKDKEIELIKTKADLGGAMAELARKTAQNESVEEIQYEIAERQDRIKFLEDEFAAGMVYAPVNGQLSLESVPLGAKVKENDSILAKIGQKNPVVVRFEVSEEEKNFLSTNNPKATLKLSDGSDYPREGKIKFVEPLVVEVTFDNPIGSLTLGETVKIELVDRS